MSVSRSLEEAEQIAEQADCIILRPTGLNCLMLDLDGTQGIEAFERRHGHAEKCLAAIGIRSVAAKCWTSRSGSGLHVWLTLQTPLESIVECLLFQSLFGSDPIRDEFGIENWRSKREDPRMLFQPRDAEIHEGWIAVKAQAKAVKMVNALKGFKESYGGH